MDDMDPLKFRCIPRPKDFADFADYFVRKVSRAAVAGIRSRTPFADRSPV